MGANILLSQLGQVVATPGAIEAIRTNGFHAYPLLQRHMAGDWGDMDAEDKSLNDEYAKQPKGSLHSAYKLSDTLTIWIITESDRSVTTFLLPEEY